MRTVAPNGRPLCGTSVEDLLCATVPRRVPAAAALTRAPAGAPATPPHRRAPRPKQGYDDKRNLLAGTWKLRCQDIIPPELSPECETATARVCWRCSAGLRRLPSSVGTRHFSRPSVGDRSACRHRRACAGSHGRCSTIPGGETLAAVRQRSGGRAPSDRPRSSRPRWQIRHGMGRITAEEGACGGPMHDVSTW